MRFWRSKRPWHNALSTREANLAAALAELEPRETAVARGKKALLDLVAWLDANPAELKGTVVQLPSREDVPHPINEQLIVELCSK